MWDQEERVLVLVNLIWRKFTQGLKVSNNNLGAEGRSFALHTADPSSIPTILDGPLAYQESFLSIEPRLILCVANPGVTTNRKTHQKKKKRCDKNAIQVHNVRWQEWQVFIILTVIPTCVQVIRLFFKYAIRGLDSSTGRVLALTWLAWI